MSSLLPFSTTTISINGLNIRYCRHGQGTPLLLLHGLGASLEYWYKNISVLAEKHEVIALDLPGFGESDKPENISYHITFYADFIKSFLNALNIHELHLAAHSLGGILALQYALQYPQEIKKLVLLDNVGFATQLGLGFRLLTVPVLNKLLLHFNKTQYAAVLRQHVYDGNVLSNEFVDAMYPIAAREDTKRVLLKILMDNASLFGIKLSAINPVRSRLAALSRLPILLFWGKQDPILAYEPHTKEARRLLPHATLIRLDECGHIPQIEKSTFVNEAILNFLGTV